MQNTVHALTIIIFLAVVVFRAAIVPEKNFQQNLLNNGSAQITITVQPATLVACITLALIVIPYILKHCQARIVIGCGISLFIYIAYQTFFTIVVALL